MKLPWSKLVVSIDPAYATSFADPEESKFNALLNDAFASLVNPFCEEPIIEGEGGSSAADEVTILRNHLELYKLSESTCAKLLSHATLKQKQELEVFQTSIFGHSFFSGKVSSQTLALSLLFNERRSLLITLLNLFSQDKMFTSFKKRMVEGNLMSYLLERAQNTHEHLHHLLSSPLHRGAFEIQVQIGQLIWERNTLFQVMFCASIEFGSQFQSNDLSALLQPLNFLSIASGNSVREDSSRNIMSRPSNVLEGWGVTNRSFTIDCLVFVVLGLLRLFKTFEGAFPEGNFCIYHDGLKGFIDMAWALFLCPQQSEQQSHTLLGASNHRALGFLRCLLQSAEFRQLDIFFDFSLSAIAQDFILELMAFVVTNVKEEYNGVGLFRSRVTKEKSFSDSLEDILEAWIVVLGKQKNDRVASQFFFPSTKEHIFLLHCERYAVKSVYFRFLQALSGLCKVQVSQFCAQRRYFVDLFSFSAPESCSRLELGCLIESSESSLLPLNTVEECFRKFVDVPSSSQADCSLNALLSLFSGTNAMWHSTILKQFSLLPLETIRGWFQTLNRISLLRFLAHLIRWGSTNHGIVLLEFVAQVFFVDTPKLVWEEKEACLHVFVCALQGKVEEYKFWVLTWFCREFGLFGKLMEILHFPEGRDLKTLVRVGCRQKDPEWYLAGSRSDLLAESLESKELFGLLSPAVTITRLVAQWLMTRKEEYIFDNGDFNSQYRIQACLWALTLLSHLVEFFPALQQWERCHPNHQQPPSLAPSTLLLTRADVYIPSLASLVSFERKPEMQSLTLFVLNDLANHCSDPDAQVFAWIKPSCFPPGEAVFQFLCRHRPQAILKQLLTPLLQVIQTTNLNSMRCAEAIRTLALIDDSTVLPSGFASSLLKRFLDYLSKGFSVSCEWLWSLSWTLRLDKWFAKEGFVFQDPHIIFQVTVAHLEIFPEASLHVLHSWRLFVESFVSLKEPGLNQLALQCQVAIGLSPANAALDCAMASLFLLNRVAKVDKRQDVLNATVSNLLRLHPQVHAQAFCFELAVLMLLLSSSSSQDESLVSKTQRLELCNVCAGVCADTNAPLLLQSLSYIVLARFVKDVDLVAFVRQGVFQAMIANHHGQEPMMILLEQSLLMSTRSPQLLLTNMQNVFDWSVLSLEMLRLVLAISVRDVRFCAAFVQGQRKSLLSLIRDDRLSLAVVSILCQLDSIDDEELEMAVLHYALHHGAVTESWELVRMTMLFLLRTCCVRRLEPDVRRVHLDSLHRVISFQVMLPERDADLEMALLLLFRALSAEWTPAVGLPVLKKLFPHMLAKNDSPSPVEEYIFSKKENGLFQALVPKICELRFL